jgi:hypothetical protein
MEGMPAETPAFAFSGERTGAVPARALVARFGVRGLVLRTFEVRDDTVGGASIGAKTTTRAKVEQSDSLPLSGREEVLCSLIRGGEYYRLSTCSGAATGFASFSVAAPGFLAGDDPLGPDVGLSSFVVITPFLRPCCPVRFSN